MRILALAGRRLAASIPTLVLILVGVFLLLQFAPGDTVDAMMAQMGGGDAATARELRKFYGLDLSVPMQLGNLFPRHVVSLVCGKVESFRDKKCSAEAVAFEDRPNRCVVRLCRIVEGKDDQLVGNWFKAARSRGQRAK